MLVRFLVRLLIAAGLAAAVAWAVRQGIAQLWTPPTGAAATARDGKSQAVVLLAVTGLVDVAIFLLLARLLRITEVTNVLGVLTARLRR